MPKTICASCHTTEGPFVRNQLMGIPVCGVPQRSRAALEVSRVVEACNKRRDARFAAPPAQAA